MKAGLELDKLVAEKVMDWKRYSDIPELSATGVSEYFANRTWLQISTGRTEKEAPPAYSTDITAAMEVMEKLRKSGEYCCLKMSSDHNFVWDVILIEAYRGEGPDKHEPFVVVTREELPEAICVAALKAKGVEL